MAALERRITRLEADLGADEAFYERLAAMSDEELLAEMRRIAATPWDLCTAGERQIKRTTELSDLELQEPLRTREEAGLTDYQKRQAAQRRAKQEGR